MVDKTIAKIVGVNEVVFKAESVTRMARGRRTLARVRGAAIATKEMEGTPGNSGCDKHAPQTSMDAQCTVIPA